MKVIDTQCISCSGVDDTMPNIDRDRGGWPSVQAVITVAAAAVIGGPIHLEAHPVLGVIAELAAVIQGRVVDAIHADAPGSVAIPQGSDCGNRVDAGAGEAKLIGRIRDMASRADAAAGLGTLTVDLVYWTVTAQPATAVQLGAAAARYAEEWARWPHR
ncbi:hypothetical protein ABIA39_008932 [Nocardia sp. GAS34]|uniref:hypothetical protein n=1 Tax=unclassified Nocardia TaxID=2637762 RepID=UPI003D2021A6